VSAAWIGDFRHFQVADFADQDDVGRLTQHRAQDLGERQPMLSRTWHWLMPAKLYSTGSSAGDDLAVGRFSSLSAP
jgi:hypothetical protein